MLRMLAVLWIGSSLLLGNAVAQQRSGKKQAAQAAVMQSTQVQRWEKEPDAFMGIKFGETVPECPKGDPGPTYYVPYDYPRILDEHLRCFTIRNGATALENLPDIGTRIVVNTPHLVDGRFEGLYFQFDNQDYDLVEELFIARFGKPTNRRAVNLKNQLGLALESVELSWRGANVTITLARYSSDFGKAQAHVFTRGVLQEAGRKREAERDRLKGNL